MIDSKTKSKAKQKPEINSSVFSFMPESLADIEKFVKENNGKYVLFDNDIPKLIVLDAVKYASLLTETPQETKKILVTGGAGYIGSNTALALKNQGYEVLVFDNLSNGDLGNVKTSLVVGDLLDPELVDKVFEQNRIEAVMHFAGLIRVDESMTDPQRYFRNNVQGSINLLNAMVKHDVKKLVFSSSAAVYGMPLSTPISETHLCLPVSPYGESKLMVEKMIQNYHKAYGLAAVCLRYFNAAGSDPETGLGETHFQETHLIPRVLMVANKQQESLQIFGNDFATADGTAIRDYIHVKDLAEAHVLALNKLSKESGLFIYNLGTGHGHSVSQIVEAVMEVTNRMITIEKAPRRPGDPDELVADNKKAKAELGFEPKHSDLKNIIETAWAWHKKRFGK